MQHRLLLTTVGLRASCRSSSHPQRLQLTAERCCTAPPVLYCLLKGLLHRWEPAQLVQLLLPLPGVPRHGLRVCKQHSAAVLPLCGDSTLLKVAHGLCMVPCLRAWLQTGSRLPGC
jgi:hypothetical protein